MTEEQAMEFVGRMRAGWPAAFVDEAKAIYWTEFLTQFSIEDAARALSIIQRKDIQIPSFGRFSDVIEGEANQKYKCPKCGLGFRSEVRVQEHLENVHW